MWLCSSGHVVRGNISMEQDKASYPIFEQRHYFSVDFVLDFSYILIIS